MSIQSKEVLIIEDAADLRKVVRKILENTGMTVTECGSIEEAVIILTEKTPHVILLDLNLEGMSGFDFLKIKSKLLKNQNTPVIAVSGLTDRNSVFEAISLGAQDYLVKPFAANLLIQKVRKQMKDMEFLSHPFLSGKRPLGSFRLKARVCQVGETSLIIESLARLSSSQLIELCEEARVTFGVKEMLIKTDNKPSERTGDGFFRTKINVIGLDQSLVKKFRARS